MVKHASCLKILKRELPSLKCMPLIHTSLYGCAIFTTQTRLDLGPNPSDFVQNRHRMKKIRLFKVLDVHPLLWLVPQWSFELKRNLQTENSNLGLEGSRSYIFYIHLLLLPLFYGMHSKSSLAHAVEILANSKCYEDMHFCARGVDFDYSRK